MANVSHVKTFIRIANAMPLELYDIYMKAVDPRVFTMAMSRHLNIGTATIRIIFFDEAMFPMKRVDTVETLSDLIRDLEDEEDERRTDKELTDD